MPDDSISDLWWLNRKDWREGGNDSLAAYKLGAQLQQQKREQAMRMVEFNTQQKEANVRMDSELLKNKMLHDALDDMPSINRWMMDPSQPAPTDLKSPKSLEVVSQLQDQYSKSSAGRQLSEAQTAYWKKIEALSETDRITVQAMMKDTHPGKAFNSFMITPEIAKYIDDSMERAPGRKPVPVIESEMVSKKLEEAAKAEAVGNTEKAATLRREATEIQSRLIPTQETIETYTDAEGHQNFRIIRGGAQKADKGPLTSAATTQVQERLIGGEKMVNLSNEVLSKLSGSDIGMAGNINQVVINEHLAQLIPGLYKGDVAEGRALLGMFNQQVIKTMRGSGERITEADIKRYTRFLPKPGVGESIQSARQKISTFLNEVRQEAQTDAQASGKPIPEWTLTADQIKQAFKSGAISEDKATELLKKYHADLQFRE